MTPEFMDVLESGFVQFLNDSDAATTEYLLPTIIDKLIGYGKVSVEVLETNDKWFGVTYAEDQAYVEESFKRLVETDVYRTPLAIGKTDKDRGLAGIKDTFKF